MDALLVLGSGQQVFREYILKTASARQPVVAATAALQTRGRMASRRRPTAREVLVPRAVDQVPHRSQLRSDPAPVDGVHFHPAEKRSLRLTTAFTF